jgi:putative ABC transport system permease protein
VSAAAIVSFAIGIGANTAVFSVLNAILLKPAPYPQPDRLVLLGYTFSGASVPLVSETKLNVWKDQTAWKRRFGSDPRIIGTQLRVDGSIATVVGVLDAGVDTSIFSVTADLWIPLQLDPGSTSHGPSLIAAGRLRPGVSVAFAQGQARRVAEAFRQRYPSVIGPNDTFTVAPFQGALVQSTRPSLLVLAGAVACVLLIACVNVANLALIRGSVRHREIAIRAALGAS